MEVEALPQPLQDAVLYYVNENPAFADPEEAAGLCLEASAEFLGVLEKFDIPTGDWLLREYIFIPANKDERLRQRFDDQLASFPFNTNGCYFHFVVKLGELVIDFTARQFGKENPFPAIWIER